MSTSTTALIAAGLCAAATLSSDALLDDLARKAAEGERRTRTLELVAETTVTDVLMSVNGEEVSSRMGGSDATTTATTRLVTVDRFEKSDGTRATRFVRTYEEIARASEREGGSERGGGPGGGRGRDRGEPAPLESPLEGEDVVFLREEGAYTAELPEDSPLDEEVLEGLVADLEFAALLPPGPVEPGGGWEVPLEVVSAMLRPGGNLHLGREAPEEGRGPGRGFRGGPRTDPAALDVEPELDGTFTATLFEYAEVEGVRVARIQLELDVTVRLDLTDATEEVVRETPRGEFRMITIESVVTNELEGSGELLWDLERGCLKALTVEADLERVEFDATETSFDGGDPRTMERETTHEGTLAFTYELRSAKD